ncbi:Retrotransposon Copia-like, N-terminal [Dillenia turbinata]|uniref:Retrotransposon Copia-like, N-terminal n=1 Tax=Dillenia turbinata TaxID=194707 RepID=A0AAN8Z0P6_9MAGN
MAADMATSITFNPNSNPTENSYSRFLNFNDLNNPYRLDNEDNPVVILVVDLLTGENNVPWSRSMRWALRARNKIGINGDFQRPTDPDPLLDAWERCNDLVVCWIQNSVSNTMKSSLTFVDDAREMWNELQDRYSQQNGPRIFQLKRALASLTQEQDSISVYYGKLKVLWDELYDCVIQFLMGLNESYANTRDQIMLLDPLPTVNKVFSMIQQQEIQHKLGTNIPMVESMALITRRGHVDGKSNYKHSISAKQNRPYCTFYKTSGHTLEICFKAGNADPPTCTHCNMKGHLTKKCYRTFHLGPRLGWAKQSMTCIISSSQVLHLQLYQINFQNSMSKSYLQPLPLVRTIPIPNFIYGIVV